jgi:hypothetical protein
MEINTKKQPQPSHNSEYSSLSFFRLIKPKIIKMREMLPIIENT